MVLSSYPVGICFSGNLPLFVGTASPTEVITVQLKKGAETILEDSFNPDENGNLSVDYSKVVDGLLSIKVPPFVAGSYIQSEAVAQLTATFTSSNGIDVETIVFDVVKGGVEGLADHAMFLASNFLTWQPQTKEVKYHDPEFLSYYAAVAVTVKLKAYYSNSNQVVNVANLTANNLHTVNLNYGSVASLLSGQALYYDVWVEDAGGNALTSVQRYVLIDKVFDYESILLFENSVGGIDTIRLTGQIEEKNTATLSSGLFDDFVFEFDTQPERAFTINSGYLKSEREKQWSVELLNSIQKYLIIDGALTSVYSDKPEFTAIKGELPFFEITLLCSHKTKYLNLARQTNPLPNLTISTNTGGVFFLAPRLNDLPWANSNDVLLPVQFPYENFFRKISLASILNGAGGGITLEKDPTVPSHVKAITQTQINKWDNAAVGTDYFTKIEIAAILNGSPSLPGYNKANWDTAFGWGNHSGLYQPIENQRLSTTETVSFRGIHAQDFQSIPTAAPAPADRLPGRVYIYSAGSGGGNGTPPPVHGTLIGLQDVDPTGLANGYIPYYDAPSGKFKFMANNFGSVSWTSISGRPTHLSNFVNDLGNYGNWITKLDGDGWFAPLAGYNKASWDNAASLSHSHANKSFLDTFISGATVPLNISGSSANTSLWGGLGIDWSATNTNPVDVLAWDGSIQKFRPTTPIYLKAALNINDGSTLANNISGNSATVSNGVYSNLSYSNPSWIASLAYGKLIGAPTALSQFANDLGLSAVYHPIENQRLSTGDAVAHRGIHAQDFQSIPTAAPAPADRVPGRVYIYSAGSGGGSGTPPPIHGTFIGLQDVDATGLANGYIPYYDAPSGKFKFMANNFGSIAWTAVTGRPTHLSSFVNDLGNYGNWITKLNADGWYAPLAGYNKVNWDAAFSQSHTHTNKSLLDLINQNLSKTGSPEFVSPIFYGSTFTDNLHVETFFNVQGYALVQAGLQVDNGLTISTGNGGLFFKEWLTSSYGIELTMPPSIFGNNTIALPSTSGQLALVSQIPTNVVYNDGGTYNINISGNAAKFGGFEWDGLDKTGSISDFLVLGTNAKWGFSPPNGVKSALGLPSDSSLLHRSIGFAGGYPGANANTVAENTSSFSYANGAPYNGALVHFGNGGYGLQFSAEYGNNNLAYRSRNGDTATWQNWKQIVFDGYNVTWNLNISGSAAYWGGRKADFDTLVSDVLRLTAVDNATGVVRQASSSSVKQWLGLPTSGAYDLQWVASNGNLSNNTIFITGSNRPIGNPSGAALYMQQNGNDGATVESYNYSSSTALPLFLNPNGANVGINTLTPSARLDVNGNTFVGNYGSDSGGNWTNAQLRVNGMNPAIGFHYPTQYGAALWMNGSGVLNWNGGGIYTSSYMQSDSQVIGQRIVAGYDSGVAGSINTNNYLRVSGSGGIWWATNAVAIEGHNANGASLGTNQATVELRLQSLGVTRGFIYADNGNAVGFLNNVGSWALRVQSDSWAFASSFNADNWFRSSGATGWYNSTYAGGIYMEDGTWVRTYNGRGFYVSGGYGIVSEGLVKAGTGQGFQNIGYQAGRNRIWSFANADNYGLSYHQGSGSIYGMDGVGIHFGDANAPQFNFKQDGVFNATKKVTAPVVEATAALAIPTGPPPVNLRESGKSYIYSAS